MYAMSLSKTDVSQGSWYAMPEKINVLWPARAF